MQFGKVLAMVVLLAGLALTGLIGCAPAAPTSTAVPLTGVAADRAALEALYHATGGPEWTDNENWLSDEPLGTWYGVTTNSEGRVTELELGYPGNNLAGYIPLELGNLSELKRLELSYNQLTGSIPPELANLSNLESLFLGRNQLTGPIPPALGNLSDLENLSLQENGLTGTIPPELGNLSNLKFLRLYENRLTGTIPPELGNLSNLKRLDIGRNQLTETIPPELGNLSNLESLGLNDNRFIGSVPPELGNLPNLQTLLLYNNGLTGELPLSLMETDLELLLYEDNAGLCMPRLDSMQNWRDGITFIAGANCPPR